MDTLNTEEIALLLDIMDCPKTKFVISLQPHVLTNEGSRNSHEQYETKKYFFLENVAKKKHELDFSDP